MVFFIDVETGGLSSSDDRISLIGVFDERGVRQFASPREGELISEFLQYVSLRNDWCVSFNGDYFDFPFIRERARLCGLGEVSLPAKHLDLSYFCRTKFARRYGGEIGFISKDASCSRIGIYVPKTLGGAYCALVASQGKVVYDSVEGIRVFEHNAVDLCATASLFKALVAWRVLPADEDSWEGLQAACKKECERKHSVQNFQAVSSEAQQA